MNKRGKQDALLLDCVEPDYNPFTYLHGSLKTEKFRGHNFDNARKCFVCLIHKIETEEMTEIKRCYLLGKLIHYVADAFTFPHNNVFKGNLVQHCKYENKLHAYMAERLQKDSIAWTQAMSEKTLIEQIDKMKKRKRNSAIRLFNTNKSGSPCIFFHILINCKIENRTNYIIVF